ncbi:hypothetical protein [Adhaeretor mobilis]|uniref:Uncharacterized protein n=1 Tax=Adhaeretor mobilis TaxID=1930276 RepID=A0A517MWI5_9BACT|nr:hypothetical protein [Adhaeretor mobilis]QDS99243.1 hypothetical protein HG15A2_25650 [Adhaeretor mobilis]
MVAKDYGHLDHGFVITSQAAQGKDAKKAIAAMGSQSLPAINAKQLYVTASRGKEDVTLYVDDKQAVRRAIQGAGQQLSATEMVKDQPHVRKPAQRVANPIQEKQPRPNVKQQPSTTPSRVQSTVTPQTRHARLRQSVMERAHAWWAKRRATRGPKPLKQFRATAHVPRPQHKPQPGRS